MYQSKEMFVQRLYNYKPEKHNICELVMSMKFRILSNLL